MDGTVIHASWDNAYPYTGYGNAIGISDGTWRTAYGHLCSLYVNVGDVLRRGQPIGVEGSTGNSGGTHVHYEVWYKGALRDPIPFLNR